MQPCECQQKLWPVPVSNIEDTPAPLMDFPAKKHVTNSFSGLTQVVGVWLSFMLLNVLCKYSLENTRPPPGSRDCDATLPRRAPEQNCLLVCSLTSLSYTHIVADPLSS